MGDERSSRPASDGPPSCSTVDARPLTLSVAEAARLLGISDDLVYELLEQRVLPSIRLGRRRMIPRQAVELIVTRAMEGFDVRTVLRELHG